MPVSKRNSDVPDGIPTAADRQTLDDDGETQLTVRDDLQAFWARVRRRAAVTGSRLPAAEILGARDADRW